VVRLTGRDAAGAQRPLTSGRDKIDAVGAAFWESFALLAVLLNPFVMLVYLHDLVRMMDAVTLRRVLTRGAAISGVVFLVFAWSGDALFADVLHVRFASFLLFGGAVFLLIGIRLATRGPGALKKLRGAPGHVAGSIAMPFMIGPGTVSASVFAGARLPVLLAAFAIVLALATCVVGVLALKELLEFVRTRNEPLVERYVEIVGRISALVIGTIAVEMILRGIDLWLGRA
jgi:multiple antibiotic resistance protein